MSQQQSLFHISKVHALEERGAFTCSAAGLFGESVVLFLGRDDGVVTFSELGGKVRDPSAYDIHEGWEKGVMDLGKVGPLVQLHKAGLSKRPISQICYDEELQKVFLLTDGLVKMCSVDRKRGITLTADVVEEKRQVLKGVLCIGTGVVKGKHLLFAAVKKSIFIFVYTSSTLAPLEDIELVGGQSSIAFDAQSSVLGLVCSEHILCIALKEEYRIVDLSASGGTRVIERNRSRGVPLVERCADRQRQQCTMFLQFGKKTSAMQIEAMEGMSDVHPLVTWSDIPTKMFWVEPFYLVTLGERVGVYTMVHYDDAPKPEPVYMNDDVPLARIASSVSTTPKCAFVVSYNAVYVMSPIPFLTQIVRLAKTGLSEDVKLAFSIFRGTYDYTSFESEGNSVSCYLYKVAGFANFDRGNFSDAFEYFAECHAVDEHYMDPREILTLFGLHGPLRKYMTADIISSRRNLNEVLSSLGLSIDEKNKSKEEARVQLYYYLEQVRVLYPDPDTEVLLAHRAIDTAMLLLYFDIFSENDGDADNALFSIMRDGNVLEYEVCAQELETRGRKRCLALLKVHNGLVAEALQMLYELSHSDAAEAGVAEAVLALQHCHGEESGLVLEYLPWVLSQDPRAVKALLVPRDPPLDPEKVMPLLSTYPDDVVMEYLEFIINVEGNTESKHHTQLALIYISFIQKLMQTCPQVAGIKAGREAGLLGTLRRKLQKLLTKVPSYSSVKPYYDPIVVIAHVHNTRMLAELVLLYSYTGEHEAALKVLHFEERDLDAAVLYCKDQYKKALKRLLISVFGQRVDEHAKNLARRNSEAAAYDEFGGAEEEENGEDDGINLEDALARPDEFFAVHAKLPVKDKYGNVFTGIRKHNTYIMELLSQCLYPGSGEQGERKQNIEFALQLLAENGSELDPLLVFKLLPDHLDAALLQPYLTQVFRHTASTAMETQIQKRLAEANEKKHEADRAVLLERNVLVEFSRLCAVCGKGLGGGHLKATPDLQVAHYQCMKDSGHLSPKTNTPYWLDMHNVQRKEN